MPNRFRDPNLKPEDLLPPDQVRILDCHVEPWPDGRRFRVHLVLTPFEQNPGVEAALVDGDGLETGRATIIEDAESRLVFTMHVRTAQLRNPYQLHIAVTYPDLGAVDRRALQFTLEEQSTDTGVE